MITDDLGHRSLDRFQDLVERLLPGHVGAGCIGWRRDKVEDGEGGRRGNAAAYIVERHHESPAEVRT
jgi:hypothetical protein